MNLKNIARNNARLAIASSFLTNLSFILPIWLLYSLNVLSFSPTLSVVLFMTIWATSAFMEVPTGALSDRYGRKKIYIAGCLLLSLYPIAYILDLPLAFFFLVCLLSGIGSALHSGAILPIVHESHNKAGLSKKEYDNFLSTHQMSLFIARAASGVLGAVLYEIDPKLPFIAISITYLISAILGLFIKDNSQRSNETSNSAHVKTVFSLMKSNEVIVALLLSFVLFGLTTEAIWTGYQIFFEADGRNAYTIGILFSVIAVCSSLGAYFSRFLVAKMHPLRIMQLYGLGVLLTSLLLLQPNLALRLLAILPMGLVSGVTLFTLNSTVQHNIANKYHSTALSMVSFTQYMVYVAGSLLVGILLQLVGVDSTRKIMFATIAVSVVFVHFYVKRMGLVQESD